VKDILEANVNNRKRKQAGNQKGVALIIALVVLFLLSALAASLIFVTQSEMWASANYRLLTQSRYAAEAGAQAGVNWFKNTYVAPGTLTPFDTTKSPVQCKVAGGGCATAGSAIVLGATSNYPDSTNATQNSFNTLVGQTVPGVANATYTVTAQLMQMQSATQQTWQITSVGNIGGARSATTQVVETIQNNSNPTPRFQYAVFATGSGCNNPIAMDWSGSAYTDSYSSSSGPYTPSPATGNRGSLGNAGTVGYVKMSGSATINGSLSGLNTTTGSCPALLNSSSSGGVTGGLKVMTPPVYAPPAKLNPAPPVGTSMNSSGSCWATGAGCTNVAGAPCVTGKCIQLAPTSTSGYTYGDVVASGGTTIYLTAGTYNLNSLVLSGTSPIVLLSGPVVLNIQGIKQLNSGNPYPATNPINYLQTAVDMSGGSIANSGAPANFEIQCCGNAPAPPNGTNPGTNYCGGMTLSGGSGSGAVVYAPNSGITMSGGSDFFGAVIGNTFTPSSSSAIHYDTALANSFLSGGGSPIFSQTGFTWSKN